MASYEVLSEVAEPWKLCEKTPERDRRRRLGTSVPLEERYPGTYPGRVIAVRRKADTLRKRKPLPSLRNMASKDWRVVVLDLTEEKRQGLASRTWKIVGDRPARVTFDDRHGAVAATLRKQFPGDGVAEAAEAKIDDPFDVEGRRFAEVASLARGFLPKTVTHTGTGLYAAKVTPTKNDDTLKALQENLLQPSEDFTTSWTETRAVAIGDQTVAPDGLTTADKIDELAVVGTHGVYRILTFTNVAHTFSVYLKAGERSWGLINIYDAVNGSYGRYFDLANGVVGGVYSQAPTDSGIEDVGGGWYRCWIVATPAASSGNCAVYTAEGDGQGTYLGVVDQGIYAWGAQLNRGSSVTAYRATTNLALDPNGVNLTTGGLGTADAFKGGYVTNVTRSELRAVVSHTDGTVTLEGDLSTWAETDDLDVYDAWSAVQATVTQLDTDQGGADFTAAQEIRAYDGTFTEAVALNASLRPTAKCKLQIQAASGNTSVIFTNAGLGSGTHTITNNSVDNVEYRDIEVREVEGGSTYGIFTLGNSCTLDTCVFDGFTTGSTATYAGTACLVRDCIVRNLNTGIRQMEGRIERTRFQNITDRATWNGGTPAQLIACVFDTCTYAVYVYSSNTVPSPEFLLEITNCTFYNGTSHVYFSGTTGTVALRFRARNNIFVGASNVFFSSSASGLGRIESDRNCFYGNMNVASIAGTAKSTLADWQAVTDEDGNSPDANSIEADPLLTDPANGDFTPAAGGPADGAGVGAGVAKDVNGDAYDPRRPTIGAVSLGSSAPPGAPTLNSATDQGDGGSVECDVTAASEAHTIYIWYKKSTDSAWTKWATPRTGSGTITLTGLDVDALYLFEARPQRFDEWGPSSTVLTATPTSSTLTASGAISLPLEHVRTLLANSGTFQTLVEAVDAAAAKAYIDYPAKAAPWNRPRAVINHLEPSPSHVLVAVGKGNGFSESGEAKIVIEADIPETYQADGQEENALLWFGNRLGAIITEMGALAGPPTYLDAQEFELTECVRESAKKKAVDTFYYRGVITVRWGGDN